MPSANCLTLITRCPPNTGPDRTIPQQGRPVSQNGYSISYAMASWPAGRECP